MVDRSVAGQATVVDTFAVLFAELLSIKPLAGIVTVDVADAVPGVVGVVVNVMVAVAPVFSAMALRLALLPAPLAPVPAPPQSPVPVVIAQTQVVEAKFPGNTAAQLAPPVMLAPVFVIRIVIVVPVPVV